MDQDILKNVKIFSLLNLWLLTMWLFLSVSTSVKTKVLSKELLECKYPGRKRQVLKDLKERRKEGRE